MTYRNCPSCCSACVSEPPTYPTLSVSSPGFSLGNFLPAGTIQIRSHPDQTCSHAHAEDGWHRGFTDVTGEENDLVFLIKHKFVCATSRRTEDGRALVIRIYIIPYDLANYGGKLRNRDEAKVVAPARKYLRALLNRIVRDPTTWEGGSSVSPHGQQFLPVTIDNRTMAELYRDIPSPSFLPCGPVLGLRSELYRYQRQSVAAMVYKEVSTKPVPDPLFIPMVGLNGTAFYLQPGRMEILREQPYVAPNRGGILCEELGTGKTIMILALILSTLDQLPIPDESTDDSRPVMTPLSFRYFPDAECMTARARLHHRKTESDHTDNYMPSLVELLLHKIRVSPQVRALRDHQDTLAIRRLWQPLAANTPFYLDYQNRDPDFSRSKRNSADLGPRVLYVTTATLVIVPAHLLSQWYDEIMKHCHDMALTFLYVHTLIKLPPARTLASEYDLVLMSHSRFSREASLNNVSALRSWTICSCPLFPQTRVPNCQCDNDPDVSPLLQIRWKRLVVDEGHVSANIDANLTAFSKLLSVERKWIVTGTPTTNMLGLSFGKNSAVSFDSFDQEEDELLAQDDPPTENTNASLKARTWTDLDREDLRKLGSMMVHFLGVANFAAEPKMFDNTVMAPLLDKSGPLPGAIQVLNQVMNMQMIRHQIKDVESEVVLPAITKEEVLLDLDPYAIKSYNAFQVSVAINAVDSEREGPDYLFHPKNYKHLLIASANMNQLMFWSVSEEFYQVDALAESYDEDVQKAIARKVSNEDLDLLKQCGDHIQAARRDSLWRSMNQNESVPFLVTGLSQEMLRSWARIQDDPDNPSGVVPGAGYLQPDRLLALRKIMLSRPLMSEPDLVEYGRKVAELDHLLLSKKRRHKQHTKTVVSEDDRIAGNEKVNDAVKKMVKRGGELQEALQAAQERQAAEDEGYVGYAGRPIREGPYYKGLSANIPRLPNARLLAKSPLAGVRIHSSLSSKLNYIMNEVATYSATEKFLIFSQYPLSLAHVADGLELMSIGYVQLTSKTPPREREFCTKTFETCDDYRVLLMDLRIGARGLNLISASRVIFCEPIWQADVESQAIKRVHRMGQMRPVTVRTLVIRDTAEHYLLERRKALMGGNSSGKINVPAYQEAGMRDFIANPKFITKVPEHLPKFNFPLIDIPAPEPSSDYVQAESLTANGDEPDQKRRKVVSFENARVLPGSPGVTPRAAIIIPPPQPSSISSPSNQRPANIIPVRDESEARAPIARLSNNPSTPGPGSSGFL